MMAFGKDICRVEESPFSEAEKSTMWNLPLKQRGALAGPAIRLIVKCCVGISPEQEGIDLRVKQQTLDFRSQQKQALIVCQALLKNKSMETKDIKNDLT